MLYHFRTSHIIIRVYSTRLIRVYTKINHRSGSMETNKINQLADILENKIASRYSNNSNAAIIFRDAQCVYNDLKWVKDRSN